jgi:hypothetical protein
VPEKTPRRNPGQARGDSCNGQPRPRTNRNTNPPPPPTPPANTPAGTPADRLNAAAGALLDAVTAYLKVPAWEDAAAAEAEGRRRFLTLCRVAAALGLPRPPGLESRDWACWVREIELWLAEAAGAPPGPGQPTPPPPRLVFDDDARTITLDGHGYPITDPKTYNLFKAVAKAERPPITNAEIRSAVPGLKGKGAVAARLRQLPVALRRTLRVSTRGHWVALPPAKR